jgi:hypothetical protein
MWEQKMKVKELVTVAAFVLAACMAVNPIFAQSDNERINQGVELIKLGCGTGVSSHTTVSNGGISGGLTLRAAPGIAASGAISYTTKEAQGLVAALKEEVSDNATKLSEDQIKCMKPYIDRIFDVLFPPKSQIPETVITKKFYKDCHYEQRDIRWCGGTVISLVGTSDSKHFAIVYQGELQPQTPMNGREILTVHVISKGTDAGRGIILNIPPGANNIPVNTRAYVDSLYPLREIDDVLIHVDG